MTAPLGVSLDDIVKEAKEKHNTNVFKITSHRLEELLKDMDKSHAASHASNVSTSATSLKQGTKRAK